MPHDSRTVHFYSCCFCAQEIPENDQHNYIFRISRGMYENRSDSGARYIGRYFWMCQQCQGTHTVDELINWLDERNGV